MTPEEVSVSSRSAAASDLLCHWPLAGDLENLGSLSVPAVNHGVSFAASGGERSSLAAVFNGRDTFFELPDHADLRFGTDDFSVSAWIETDALTDVVGDLVGKFDTDTRRGWTLSVVTNSGTTTAAQSNYRHLHFGIDCGREDARWTDCGQPGNAVFIYALATVQGGLYAGTFEAGADETGHLWRYDGKRRWEDLGASPDGANAIVSIADFKGELYCGSARYYPKGSALGLALNTSPGGHVYRITREGEWEDCGNPGAEGAQPEPECPTGEEFGETDLADDASALTVFRGDLYAISFHRRGVFRYLGGQRWESVGLNSRVMTLAVYRDRLYALANGGPVYSYEGGIKWRNCGTPDGSTQTYAAAIADGIMHVGTFPEGEVLSSAGDGVWTNHGMAGYEREVMAMSLYNGKVYMGTLPMANVFRLEQGKNTRNVYMGNLDNNPDYWLRRVWSMAIYQGRLYAGTLPSGQVRSFAAGKMATEDHALVPGWCHIVAVREGGRLTVFRNGKRVATSEKFGAEDFDLSSGAPLRIGRGAHEYFRGKMSDLRIYRRALNPREIFDLHKKGEFLEKASS